MKYIATFLDHESTVLFDIPFDASTLLEATQRMALLLQIEHTPTDILQHAEQLSIATQTEFDNLENV